MRLVEKKKNLTLKQNHSHNINQFLQSKSVFKNYTHFLCETVVGMLLVDYKMESIIKNSGRKTKKNSYISATAVR